MTNPFNVSGSSPFGHSPMGNYPWGGFGQSPFNNPDVVNAANSMRSEFVNMVDERIREAMKHYFCSEEMPHFMKRAIKHLFHYEGKEHLGRAMKEMKHDMDKEEAEEEDEFEEAMEDRVGHFYGKILEDNGDLIKLGAQARCDELKKRYPRMSNKCIAHLANFLGQPHIGHLAEQDGLSLEEMCRH